MNALCSGGISVSTTRASTLSASRRVSNRLWKARWTGPYNRLDQTFPLLPTDALGLEDYTLFLYLSVDSVQPLFRALGLLLVSRGLRL